MGFIECFGGSITTILNPPPPQSKTGISLIYVWKMENILYVNVATL